MTGARVARALVAPALVVPLLGGCGEEEQPRYDPAVAERLRGDVEDVRQAAEAREPEAAREHVQELTRHVAEAQAEGELGRARARRILAAADLVLADLEALPSPQPEKTGKKDEKQKDGGKKQETKHEKKKKDRERKRHGGRGGGRRG